MLVADQWLVAGGWWLVAGGWCGDWWLVLDAKLSYPNNYHCSHIEVVAVVGSPARETEGSTRPLLLIKGKS